MNWFGGRLVITFDDSTSIEFHERTLKRAQQELNRVQREDDRTILSTMYFPYAISLEPELEN